MQTSDSDHTRIDRWRLIESPPGDGAWNMAVDEALLESVTGGSSPPVLRLYAWEPPTVSIGYAQKTRDVDRQQLAARGWGLVRRPTGGKAILHTDELTYAVLGPQTEPRLAGGILESYRRLARALLAALQDLALPAQMVSAHKTSLPHTQTGEPVCFDVPSNYEILVNGKKILGSAQARRQGGVLQHGTLPLQGDLTRIIHVLRYPDPIRREAAAQRLLNRATTVERELGRTILWSQAARAFKDAFKSSLDLTLERSELTPEERQRASALREGKYSREAWNDRGKGP